jgi:hypothetical protein
VFVTLTANMKVDGLPWIDVETVGVSKYLVLRHV